MEKELFRIKNDATSLILNAEDAEDLNKLKLEFLGKSGHLTKLTKNLKSLSEDERKDIGRLANEVKNTLTQLIEDKEKELEGTRKQEIEQDFFDVTAPGEKPETGHLHLITQGIEEITEIFKTIGFERVRHPEVEWDYYAFEALNFPANHPARDEWETFFIKDQKSPKYGPMLLTPHTSSGQVREMQNKASLTKPNEDLPPIRMLNIAKCYRRQQDVTHTQMFHQFEGLVVGQDINITHLKGVLDHFVKSYFGPQRRSRIRPYQFQFTEPSFEVDVSVERKGSRLGKEGWLELGGAGMVHPNVLKAGGYDPKKYTGFAFGWGVERVILMKEGLELDDLRILYSNNLEFINQF